MEINSTRLTSLLKEALTPPPVPSGKPDPAAEALVKALIQPPAPSTVQSAQFAAQTLNSSLAKPPAQSSQRLSSAEIENAYRAVMEPDTGTDDAYARAQARRPAADADQPEPAAAQAQPPDADNTARVAPTLPPSSFSPSIAPGVLFAANTNAPPRGGARPGHAPRSEPGQAPLWMISIVTAIVSAATTSIVLMLLR
ncbi:conserved hypothetical protein [Mesorhizobium sp. ORS 3324]|nr:conserved hypothetical protein [Mesorhizobium sp. ORS 3324]